MSGGHRHRLYRIHEIKVNRKKSAILKYSNGVEWISGGWVTLMVGVSYRRGKPHKNTGCSAYTSGPPGAGSHQATKATKSGRQVKNNRSKFKGKAVIKYPASYQ